MDPVKFRAELATATDDCNIYVLDAAKEIAPRAQVPVCDMRNPEHWSHNLEGGGIQSMKETPHWAHMHAGGYWLARGIRSSRVATAESAQADVVFLDMHCYHSWLISYSRRGGDPEAPDSPQRAITRMLRELQSMPEQERDGGAHMALYMPIPSTLGIYAPFLETQMRRALVMLPEEGLLSAESRGDKIREHEALLLPYSVILGVEGLAKPAKLGGRDIYIFYRGGCAGEPDRAAGIVLRHQLMHALVRSGATDTDLVCACAGCPDELDNAEMHARMRRSRFCPVLAGNTQASARLSEAVLAGCLPVFVGPPWPTLPLSEVIDYRSFGTFINVSDTSGHVFPVPEPEEGTNMMPWTEKPSIYVDDVMINVTSVDDVNDALRSIWLREIEDKMRALNRARPYFWYQDLPGTSSSRLVDAVVDRMCVMGKRIARKGMRRDFHVASSPGEATWHASMSMRSSLAEARSKATS